MHHAAMSARPNILFLFTDQQRFDTIRALGNSVIRTPNLDRLVRGGTSFTNAYSPAPECVPARCCLTFGQYPAQTGCYGNGDFYPTDERETFMTSLTRAGYRTHGIGKYHFEYQDYSRVFDLNGFETRRVQEEIVGRPERDDYLQFLWSNGYKEITDPHGIRGDMYYMPQPAMMPQQYHPTQWVGDQAVDFLENQAGSEQPWYGYVSFIHPHPPFAPPSPWHKLYRDLDVPPPHLPPDCEKNWIFLNRFQNRYKRYDRGFDLHRVRMMRAYYYACISFIDYQVGRILDRLEANGQLENTLILFSSDHGELLGDFHCVGKRTYHDAAARVPLLLHWPGQIPAGHRCETPVNLLEATRTFLEAAESGFDTHACEGRNLVEIANRPDENATIFTQLYARNRGVYTAIDREWKYVYSAPDQRELLFHRINDPGETTDLSGSLPPGRGNPLGTMKERLIGHCRQYGEEQALAGDDWKPYPKRDLPENPDSGLLYQDHRWAADLQTIPGYER